MKTDMSKLTLKGSGSASNLVVSTSGSTVTILSANGKLLGQTDWGHETYPPLDSLRGGEGGTGGNLSARLAKRFNS